MENSVNNHSGIDRPIMPAMLLLADLFNISWLGIRQENSSKQDPLADQDTVIRKKENAARYSRRSIITLDEKGQPHEEIVEEFEGDEEMRPLIVQDFENITAIPGISDIFPVMPAPSVDPVLRVMSVPFVDPVLMVMPVPPVDPVLPDVEFEAITDTIPFGFHFKDRKHWEEFSKDFEE